MTFSFAEVVAFLGGVAGTLLAVFGYIRKVKAEERQELKEVLGEIKEQLVRIYDKLDDCVRQDECDKAMQVHCGKLKELTDQTRTLELDIRTIKTKIGL